MRNFIIILAGFLSCTLLTAQDFSVSTNLVDYANLGTLNLEASYGFSRHWSVGASLRYNPFTYGQGEEMKSNRLRSVAAGARYWPWHIFSGWWLCGKLQAEEYNLGGFKSPETSEGDRFGGGVSGGYSYMLGHHFNVELGAGIWSGYNRYVVYQCPHCGKVVEKGANFFVLPSDIMLSLSYIF